jgi:exodeoxyribonuclease V gamma subunit
MSKLYLGTDQPALAEKLAEDLDQSARAGDLFRPATIVVPHKHLAQWLRLFLARRFGVAINLRFLYLEEALWQLLREVDPRSHDQPLELLDHDAYRLMVLSVLLDEDDNKDLVPLRSYLRRRENVLARDGCRRCWQLADRLAGLIRDYEYHRQDALIQNWLRDRFGYPRGPEAIRNLERSQKELFQRIVHPIDGKRARLSEAGKKLFKTLPQYAQEVMELSERKPPSSTGPIHLFGLSQVSSLHVRTLAWLGESFDLRMYYLSPLAAQARLAESTGAYETLRDLAEEYREPQKRSRNRQISGDHASRATRILANSATPLGVFGRAAGESLALVGELTRGPFGVEVIPERSRHAPAAAETVLARLQDYVLSGAAGTNHVSLPQDTSLQIVACPSSYREIETVYQSILDNLNRDPALRQNDVAVLVTDMARYRPVVQAVFDRQSRLLSYSLADFSAAGVSLYGQALLDFLDLALESFARSRVFKVLLNPCVLAKLGVDREQAASWLTWAENLGIYHGWDQEDKRQRGYPNTPLYSWRFGLQRLRLGRLMHVAPEEDGAARHFHGIIPYADLASGDKEQLDAFCRAVEGLLPVLAGLRKFQGTGEQWALQLQRLMQTFLDVPADRPEEAPVRDSLLSALARLGDLDRLHAAGDKPGVLPLALVREYLHGCLDGLPGSKGSALGGGVTIASLQNHRPIPFRLIYLVGLSEDLFPGSNNLPTFDLRSHKRAPGDIRPAEFARNQLLEALLAARDKVYLLYTAHELQQDRVIQPGVPVVQLRRFVEESILDGRKFDETEVPLRGSDPKYLDNATGQDHGDVLVNFDEAERLLAISEACEDKSLTLKPQQLAEIERRRKKYQPDFSVGQASSLPKGGRLEACPTTVGIRELRRFLLCPAEAALRRHLRLDDEDESEPEDCEPFLTGALRGSTLVRTALEQFVARSVKSGVDEALADWRPRFRALHDDWQWRCRVPEEAFGEVDQAAFEQHLHERISGPGRLAAFLREREQTPFCGPILLGESWMPVHARLRFPALSLSLDPKRRQEFLPSQVRLIGSMALAWRTGDAFDTLVLHLSKTKVGKDDLAKPLLESVLFFLALRAGFEASPDGVSSADWLGGRAFCLHLAQDEGITTYSYAAEETSAQEARAYLTDLAADFLDPTAFDLLPLELIVQRGLRIAFRPEPDQAPPSAEEFPRLIEDAYEDNREAFQPDYRQMQLLEMVSPKVPLDALEKVRKRYGILDRGPARNAR